MSVDQKQLDQLKQTLQADDYRMDVDVQGDAADVAIVAGPNACEECLVPKSLMQSMLGPVLGIDPASIRAGLPDRLPRRPRPGLLSVEISLEGKVALVTGVGPNIGSGVALALAKYGAKVACNDVSNEVITACIARIERNGGEAMAAPGDVTDEAAVQGYVDAVLEKWGRIDILVNNAAILGGKGVLDETAADFERAVRVAGLGYFLNTKHVGRAMAQRGIRGSIVCISSSNGWNGSAGVIAYAFHKGGVNNFVAGRGDGPRALRHPGQQLHPDGADHRQPRAARRAGRAGPAGGHAQRRPQGRWARRRHRRRGVAPSRPLDRGTPAAGADGHDRHPHRHRSRGRLALLGLCTADHRHRPRRRRGARAKNFAYSPAAPEDLAGPLPLIPLDDTPAP